MVNTIIVNYYGLNLLKKSDKANYFYLFYTKKWLILDSLHQPLYIFKLGLDNLYCRGGQPTYLTIF